jgi:VanZ family protein
MKAFRIPLLWLGIVLLLGSSYFGTQQTGAWVIPALTRVVPWATARELHALHAVLRKLAHLTEYAILARLWWQGLLAWSAWRAMTLRTATWGALLICAACAFADEAHQSLLPTRTGSVADALLDCLGALLMLLLLRARYAPRETAPIAA